MKSSWQSTSWVAELTAAAVKWNLSYQWSGPPPNWITTNASVTHRIVVSRHIHSGQIHFSFLQTQYSASHCYGPSQLCWSVLFLSPFGHWQRWSTSHFTANLLVLKCVQPYLWALLLCCCCCTVIVLQITSAKRPMKATWASWLCLQQHSGLAVSPAVTSIPQLTGRSSNQDHCTSSSVSHTRPIQLFLSTTRVRLCWRGNDIPRPTTITNRKQ